MTAPTRKPVVLAEATQELKAADVVGVLGAFESGGVSTAGVALPRKPLDSQSSIAPVGLDLAKGADPGEEDDVLDVVAPAAALPARRRRLGKIVGGALGACAVILVAAVVARFGQTTAETSASASTAGLPNANEAAATAAEGVGGAPASPATTPGNLAAAAAPGPGSAGTVRLAKPTLAGHVWLDGKKLSATSVLVSCGTHQIKVGYGRKHSIDVPCGGEIAVGK
jgi:hypothetical protein